MAKQGTIKVTGTVIDSMANSMFRVQLDDIDSSIVCHMNGKMRTNSIRVITGDRVEVEMSPYDLTKGRICNRLKVQQ